MIAQVGGRIYRLSWQAVYRNWVAVTTVEERGISVALICPGGEFDVPECDHLPAALERYIHP